MKLAFAALIVVGNAVIALLIVVGILDTAVRRSNPPPPFACPNGQQWRRALQTDHAHEVYVNGWRCEADPPRRQFFEPWF